MCKSFSIPKVTETIVVDENLHVKLFSSGVPIPLPSWFTRGSDCRLTKKSILANFPPYIKTFSERTIDYNILDELQKIKFKKPEDRPKFTSEILQFSLLLRYTSLSAYELLLKEFPLPSISLLSKLSKGGVEPLKAAKLLLNEEKTDKDVVLLLDEMYLQKELQYQQGQLLEVIRTTICIKVS